jgi:hypothetical protein
VFAPTSTTTPEQVGRAIAAVGALLKLPSRGGCSVARCPEGLDARRGLPFLVTPLEEQETGRDERQCHEGVRESDDGDDLAGEASDLDRCSSPAQTHPQEMDWRPQRGHRSTSQPWWCTAPRTTSQSPHRPLTFFQPRSVP